MFTFKLVPPDRNRLMLWLIALGSAAATGAVYRWLPGWVPMMRIVTEAAGAIILAWLLVEWVAHRRHERQTFHDPR
jgi:membrane protein implicated in regulation of membrane protease activity